MSRQQEERRRMVCEMLDRFGAEDPMVHQWLADVDSLQHIDLSYPLQFPAWSSVRMESVVQCPARTRRIQSDTVKH